MVGESYMTLKDQLIGNILKIGVICTNKNLNRSSVQEIGDIIKTKEFSIDQQYQITTEILDIVKSNSTETEIMKMVRQAKERFISQETKTN